MLVNNYEIAKAFNKHFAETVEELTTFECPSNTEDLTEDTLTKITKKFKNCQNSKIQVLSKLNINT